MELKGDVTLTLPAEYFDSLSAVFSAGLKHANIKSDDRKQLEAWWKAESELVGEAIDDQRT